MFPFQYSCIYSKTPLTSFGFFLLKQSDFVHAFPVCVSSIYKKLTSFIKCLQNWKRIYNITFSLYWSVKFIPLFLPWTFLSILISQCIVPVQSHGSLILSPFISLASSTSPACCQVASLSLFQLSSHPIHTYTLHTHTLSASLVSWWRHGLPGLCTRWQRWLCGWEDVAALA